MAKIENSHYCLLIGTESLLTKSNQGTSLVANELTHLLDKHKQWVNTSKTEVDKCYASVIPILLTGTYESSFPKYYRNHRVIEGFINSDTSDVYRKSYLFTFKELLNNLYRTRSGFDDIWESIPNLNNELLGLAKSSVLNYINKEEKEINNKMQQFVQQCDHLLEKHLQESIIKPQLSVNKWNLPTVNYFIGRDEELRYLEQAFKQDPTLIITSQTEEKHTQALTGMAGIGKTKLAAAFAHRAAITMSYKVIAWFNAGTNFSKNLGDFCQEVLKISIVDQTEEELVKEIYQVREHKYLLIFDDVSNYTDFSKYLPSSIIPNIDIIVTSRSQHWGTHPKLALRVFTHDEAVKFVQGILKNEHADNCKTLAGKLGYLPLALAQAVAYIQQCGTNITNYILTFEEHTKELLDSSTFPDDHYKQTVLAVLSLTLANLASKNQKCLAFLYSCSLLNNMAIPKELLKTCLFCDNFQIDNIIKILLEYSLIEVDSNTNINIHPLVQEVLLLISTIEEKKEVAVNLIAYIINNTPKNYSDDFSLYPLLTECMPHGLSLFQNLKRLDMLNHNIVKLQLSLINYIDRENSDHKKAYALFEDIRNIPGNLLAPILIQLSIDQARNLCSIGQGKSGLEKLNSLLNTHGLSNSLTSLIYFEKMKIYMDLNELVEADNCFNKIKEIKEYLPKSKNLAETLHVAGQLRFKQGLYSQAIELLELSIKEKIKFYKTPYHHQIAAANNFLGQVYSISGDNYNAMKNFHSAKEIFEHSYHGKIPYYTLIGNNYRLAEALYRINNYVAAKEILEKLITQSSDHLSETQQKNIPIFLIYSKTLFQLGYYKKGKDIITKSLLERKDKLILFLIHLNLGKFLSVEGNYEHALIELQKAELNLLDFVKDLKNHNGARLLFYRAEIYYLQNNLSLAEASLKEVIKIQSVTYNNKNHSFLAETYLCLAKVYFKQKKYRLCSDNIEMAFRMQSSISCIPNDPLISEIQREQARLLCINNKNVEAEETIKKVLLQQTSAYQNENHIEIALTQFIYALILEYRCNYSLAKQKKQEALNILNRIEMNNHPLAVEITDSLKNANNITSSCYQFWYKKKHLIMMTAVSLVGTAAAVYTAKYNK